MVLTGNRRIEDLVTKIGQDEVDFFKFAYELRRLDPSDKYTWEFLNGAVQPSILVSMILANKWNASAKKMNVDKKKNNFVFFSSFNNEIVTIDTTSKGCSPPFLLKNISDPKSKSKQSHEF